MGKGIVVSKKNKQWWKKKKNKPLIVELQEVVKATEDINHKRDAQSFCDYFVRNGFLTSYMKVRGRELCEITFGKRSNRNTWKRTQKKWGKHYLYAISDGEYLKVGFSVDPKKRLKSLKTGSPREIKIVWQTICAYNSVDALKEEKKLHRRLSNFAVRGEWFKGDALHVCKSWRIYKLDHALNRYLSYLEWNDEDRFNEIAEAKLDEELLASGELNNI